MQEAANTHPPTLNISIHTLLLQPKPEKVYFGGYVLQM